MELDEYRINALDRALTKLFIANKGDVQAVRVEILNDLAVCALFDEDDFDSKYQLKSLREGRASMFYTTSYTRVSDCNLGDIPDVEELRAEQRYAYKQFQILEKKVNERQENKQSPIPLEFEAIMRVLKSKDIARIINVCKGSEI